tara:strand:- start:293 stop:799 length:507 start_codon:yes stop_codon:yes gene_type:complete
MNIVWFNGHSAKTFLHTLPKQQLEIGCNYIYKDRAVDHVCVYDWQMFKNIKSGPYKLWCRNGQKDPRFQEVIYSAKDQPHSSGVMALRLAINLNLNHVYVIGCDWGISSKSIYDYDTRNSELKYTNSQKRLVERMSKEIDITFIAATAKPIDIACHQISPDKLLSYLC